MVEWCPQGQPDLSFRGNELAGETGEACNVIKKLERERLGYRGSRDTIEHLAEELADVIIVADMIACDAGFELGPAIIAKFNATSEKYGLATRIPVFGGCAACDRGDYSIGHADDCPQNLHP
jgi:NTP pyrophosphatase (non-canonical NTP hydrolase)